MYADCMFATYTLCFVRYDAKCFAMTMTLLEYTAKLPRGGQVEMAKQLGISTVYLSQLIVRRDGREPSAELAVKIERHTQGAVTRRELRPNDWHQIWPELEQAEQRVA